MARTTTQLRFEQTPKLEPETFLSEHRAICDLLIEAEEGKASSRAALAAAKARGIDLKAYKMVQKWSQEDRKAVEHTLTNALYYARLLDLGLFSELDLFGDNAGRSISGLTDSVLATHRAWQAEKDGREAGKAGGALDNNPHTVGTEQHARYVVGWRDGDAMRQDAEANAERIVTPRRKSAKNPEDNDAN